MVAFGDARLIRPLWPHQERALAKLDLSREATYLVVPPGGGKTLIGLEAARRIGRRTLVLCPNTAIQAQWLAQWQASFAADGVDATTSRAFPTPLTVLTYQAVCTDSSIHQDGAWLLSSLRESGPMTLVLDECHHLLEVWGRMLREVVGTLGQPHLPAAVVYHAVPAVLGGNKKSATIFARSWNARVSPGELLYSGSPEGAGILAVSRDDDPFAVTTQIRTLWR